MHEHILSCQCSFLAWFWCGDHVVLLCSRHSSSFCCLLWLCDIPFIAHCTHHHSTSMATNEDKAEEWMMKAEKRLKGFSLFGGGQARYEDAAESFTKAANLYKLAKKCTQQHPDLHWHSKGDQAGGAFVKAAEMHLKLDSKHEAATDYYNAANCYKKENAQGAHSTHWNWLTQRPSTAWGWRSTCTQMREDSPWQQNTRKK